MLNRRRRIILAVSAILAAAGIAVPSAIAATSKSPPPVGTVSLLGAGPQFAGLYSSGSQSVDGVARRPAARATRTVRAPRRRTRTTPAATPAPATPAPALAPAAATPAPAPTPATSTSTSTAAATTSARHFMDFGPSAACPDGSGTGCAGNPDAYPLSGSYCASAIVPDSTERIQANASDNATKGPATVATANYGPWTENAGEPKLERDIEAAAGQYTGTTDDILEWAACEEGWNENWARAEAYVESSWQQSEAADTANGCAHSFGILQVRDSDSACPANHDGWGGYPYTHESTAFDAEMQMSYLRACYDGVISYLYPTGQTVASIAAAHGWTYVAWGCVGSWFSGAWYDSGAQQYIAQVQAALGNQSWKGL